MKYSRWEFISYHSIDLVQRETGKDTSVRFSTTTECTNWNHNETKGREDYLGQFAVDANLDGVTHYGVYLNNVVFEWWKHKGKGKKSRASLRPIMYKVYRLWNQPWRMCISYSSDSSLRLKKKTRRKRIIKSQESIV